jgi:uncharacterized protein YlxW (UPF0749 family)
MLAGELRRLRSERADLQREYERLQREIADAEAFASGSEAFEAVAQEQRARLESVNLLAVSFDLAGPTRGGHYLFVCILAIGCGEWP